MEQAQATKVLALNQGLYNLALAILLAWAAFMGHVPTVAAGLVFVVAMGVVGAVTVSWRIIVLQSAAGGGGAGAALGGDLMVVRAGFLRKSTRGLIGPYSGINARTNRTHSVPPTGSSRSSKS